MNPAINDSAAPAQAPAAAPETDRFGIHLAGRGMSGRVVRYRTLTIDQIDRVEAMAAGAVGKDGTMLQFQRTTAQEGIEQMVYEVSDPVTPDKRHEARFQKVAAEQLHDAWKSFFTTRDTQVLRRVYEDAHIVTKEDLESIFAGKVPLVD